MEALLAAHSGGTAWDSHPLRVAAGANVSCAGILPTFGRIHRAGDHYGHGAGASI